MQITKKLSLHYKETTYKAFGYICLIPLFEQSKGNYHCSFVSLMPNLYAVLILLVN